jgi:uncharacterized protein YkwD
MRIIAIRAWLVCGILIAAPGIAAAQVLSPLESGILKTLNEFRGDPAGYAAVLKEQRQYYRGDLLEIPGHTDLLTQEGVRPLDEAIAALEAAKHSNLGRVSFSTGLSHAAADHVLDTGRRGLISHGDFEGRINRYGTWSGAIGENISYGPREGREVIVGLLVDDGVANRAHRKSLLDPRWRYAGIACGFHARYGTMCVIDLAANYQDR